MRAVAVSTLLLLVAASGGGCILPSRSEHALYVDNNLDRAASVAVVMRTADTNATVFARTFEVPAGAFERVAEPDLDVGARYVVEARWEGLREERAVTAHSGSWSWTVHVEPERLAISELHGD